MDDATDQMKKHSSGVCSEAAIPDVDEQMGLVLFVLSFFIGVWATWVGSCIDKKGFNGTAFCAGVLQVFTMPCCCAGVYWCWVHNYKTYEKAKCKANGEDFYYRVS